MLISKIITTVFIIAISGYLVVGKTAYFWRSTNEWTPCSKPCGKGEETQMFICLKKTHYRTEEYQDPKKCSGKALPKITKPCSLGQCPQGLTGSFVWQVGNWSLCPKNCGGGALQYRDVNCYMMTSKGEFLLSKLSKCDYKVEPARYINCAKADCPPKFLTSKWEKCPISTDCKQQVRRREVKCVSLLSSGSLKIQSSGICYRMREKPPSSWMHCQSNLNQHCLELKKENKKAHSIIKIKQENSEIHQMRHTKRLKVFVGQTAYVFGFSRLSLFCPVSKIHRNKIMWIHENKSYEYDGSLRERIKVNPKGALIIREFYLKDAGIWRCKVGKYTADVVLRLEQQSTGFDNWLKRHANHNYGMLNEESNVSFIRPESIVWMKSEWSPCSTTCENKENSGFQTRRVTCEKIESQYYKIIDDKYCPPTKPISVKKCKSADLCPVWKVLSDEQEQCTDECVNVGVAKTSTKIICEHNNKSVDLSFCDRDKIPKITCPNIKCQISYYYGPWSQCSLSCSNTTDRSIRSRTMKCVWNHTLKPAYHLCQQHQLSFFPLTKPCRVPKCILGCKDLTPACAKQSKYRCRSSLFYHFCCAFCKKQFS